ncbi:tetratricopeptide repeat protein [Reichenbachiella versicolor]|uniref:tetratricopeptide repeat protein n=1 Tax=Reichenbachiella versicolor TaxID=1821036 RepID=UPI000D6E929A|nr:tetratricopeptide repeat protein [Reichenbachiella versicolor]
MNKYRLGLIIVAIILIGILYSLPRVVVDNDSATEAVIQEENIESSHEFTMSALDEAAIASLQKKLSLSTDNEKNAIFADSLARIYLSYNELDSSALYIDSIIKYQESVENYLKAGELYYQIYGISLNQEKAKAWAMKAGKYFEKVLETSNNPDTKAKLAMTKVMTTNPMEGIMMLKGVLEEYPENKTALYNMGLMSVQSGQYEKAVGRFEKLMTIDPTNTQAAYYLAVSYYESGKKSEAKEMFTQLKNESKDPAVLSSAEQYLKILNEL